MAEASIKDLGAKSHLDALQATIGPVHGLRRRAWRAGYWLRSVYRRDRADRPRRRQFSSGRCRSCCEGPVVSDWARGGEDCRRNLPTKCCLFKTPVVATAECNDSWAGGFDLLICIKGSNPQPRAKKGRPPGGRPVHQFSASFLLARQETNCDQLRFNQRSRRVPVRAPRPRSLAAPEVAARSPLGLRTEESATRCARRETQARRDATRASLY
jgi:hypothetical protein